ncbi:MAG: hypothetical protein EXQ52_12555 [Bryobacterales bacterium]|nr:hypothetical protein [Bryobacterales bacterium]
MRVLPILSLLLFLPVPARAQAIETPFTFHRNEIVLQVKVNGKGPFNMLLDTGTNRSAIDLATARVTIDYIRKVLVLEQP